MNISFGQIYPEIDTDFKFTNTILIELRNRINSTNQSFSDYENIFKTRDFSTTFIISATKKMTNLRLMAQPFLKRINLLSLYFTSHIKK